jgi:hypothetical protein
MEPIFKTSFLTNNVFLFSDKIVYATGIAYMKKEEMIFLKNIASVETNIFNVIKIKTNSGQEYKLVVKMKDKENLKIAIMEAIEKYRN